MPTSVVSLLDRNDPGQFKKGPATDASMITRMKREAAIVSYIKSNPRGLKGTGAVVDGQMSRGFDSTSIRTTFLSRGAGLGFFRVV
jgi:hypothetical protein